MIIDTSTKGKHPSSIRVNYHDFIFRKPAKMASHLAGGLPSLSRMLKKCLHSFFIQLKNLGVAKTLKQWVNLLTILLESGEAPTAITTPQSMERESPHTFGNLQFDEPSNIYRRTKYRHVYISFRPEDPRMYCFIRLLVVP